jgi:hypothetical protein
MMDFPSGIAAFAGRGGRVIPGWRAGEGLSARNFDSVDNCPVAAELSTGPQMALAVAGNRC